MKYVIYKHVYKDLDSILAEMAKLLILWVLKIFLVINPYGELIKCMLLWFYTYVRIYRQSKYTYCTLLRYSSLCWKIVDLNKVLSPRITHNYRTWLISSVYFCTSNNTFFACIARRNLHSEVERAVCITTCLQWPSVRRSLHRSGIFPMTREKRFIPSKTIKSHAIS